MKGQNAAYILFTSGSTGSPKLVRLSGRNLDANTRSIVEYLELDEGQRPVTNLAMSYSYGMSIVNTHLLAGAALVLTRRSVLERPFWELSMPLPSADGAAFPLPRRPMPDLFCGRHDFHGRRPGGVRHKAESRNQGLWKTDSRSRRNSGPVRQRDLYGTDHLLSEYLFI